MKHFAKDLLETIKRSDWFDWAYLIFIVLAGALFGVVMSELSREFKG